MTSRHHYQSPNCLLAFEIKNIITTDKRENVRKWWKLDHHLISFLFFLFLSFILSSSSDNIS